MEPVPDFQEQLQRLKEMIEALRNQEVDSIIGSKHVLLLRIKETEEALTDQRCCLERLLAERTRLLEELRHHQDHLEYLVKERTRELRDLSHRLITAQEDERNLIGNELHDQIGQHLTYTTLLLDQLAHKQRLKESPELLAARGAVQDAIGKIRNLSNLLSPRLLRSSGLIVALDSLIEEYIRNTRIPVGFHHEVDIDALPKELALACFRVIQESLTNIARHAKAGRVEVGLSSTKDSLHLEISDDGTGFDTMKVEHSTGLTGMRERALALGGELVISSRPGQGTRITADFLLERSNDR